MGRFDYLGMPNARPRGSQQDNPAIPLSAKPLTLPRNWATPQFRYLRACATAGSSRTAEAASDRPSRKSLSTFHFRRSSRTLREWTVQRQTAPLDKPAAAPGSTRPTLLHAPFAPGNGRVFRAAADRFCVRMCGHRGDAAPADASGRLLRRRFVRSRDALARPICCGVTP